MGRDWLSRASGGGGRGGGGMTRASTRRQGREEDTSTGCMCAVFQLFDFQVPLNSKFLPGDPFLHPTPANTSTGEEAPGNNLELKEQENLHLPAGFQIKTRLSSCGSNSRAEDLSTACSVISSPGMTKTPNLVARLMGLDLLPECSSPSLSSGPSTKSLRKDCYLLRGRSRRGFLDDSVRSLPETPRMSSARRSDSEYHRLSLQINRENIKEEFKLPAKIRARERLRHQVQDENRSPGQYAKQIVKQIKESVSRKVGHDITNINRENRQDIRKDENLVLLKPSKKKKFRDLDETSPDGKQSAALSCSPKLRLFDTNRNKQVTNSGTKIPRTSLHQSPGISNPPKQNSQVTIQQDKQQWDIKKLGNRNSCPSSRKLPRRTYEHAIGKKKEEPYVHSAATNRPKFIDKKSKKAPLSSELVNANGPILLPVKKHPSPPATRLPQKQAQVSSKTRHSYQQTDKIFTVKTSLCATSASSAAAEYRCYIQWILDRSGIVSNVTPWNLGKCHAPSHPLDPSIFYYLELFNPAAAAASTVLSHRCNRKLIFQLVDELLADILRPRLDLRPWVSPVTNAFALVDELCSKIESFPAANCQVLEDIDCLIGRDFGKSQRIAQFEEEWEGLACVIVGEIMDDLVCETAAVVGGRTAE